MVHKVYATAGSADIREGSVELILWRHAEAVDGSPDHERELTAKGVKQAQKMAAFLRQHLSGKQHRILVSPTARTRQTVAALTDQFTLSPDIAPGASAQALLRAAKWPEGSGTLLVVGHQPTLGEVAAQLLGSTDYSLTIKKGALWWFNSREYEDSARVALRLVITPDFL